MEVTKMNKLCRLITYDYKGKRLNIFNHSSIYQAVEQGYSTNLDFLVCEREEEYNRGIVKHYWSGSYKDKEKSDFNNWKFLAEEKDYNK
jgi:hypothetical protein